MWSALRFSRSVATIIRATSVRLPIQLFFKVSGLFLFVLAIVFAGNGVFELQNAGVLITTNLAWMGRGLPWAGLFPNLQVLSVQGLLLFGAVAAWLVVPRSAMGTSTANPRASSWRRSAGERTGEEARDVAAMDRSERGRGDPRERRGRARLEPELEGRGTHRSSESCLNLLEILRVRGQRPPAGFREYPIGEDVEKNQMRIAAVYLPPVEMDGMPGAGRRRLIHLEADIHATEGNRNGFAKDEFVPVPGRAVHD